jgi:hypothetical protein
LRLLPLVLAAHIALLAATLVLAVFHDLLLHWRAIYAHRTGTVGGARCFSVGGGLPL